ncbi:hypothetical protein ACJX0J_037683, partial [Zea mays]
NKLENFQVRDNGSFYNRGQVYNNSQSFVNVVIHPLICHYYIDWRSHVLIDYHTHDRFSQVIYLLDL